MGRGDSLGKAADIRLLWPTRSVPLTIAHPFADSPRLILTQPISSRFTRSCSDPPSLAWIHSDWRCLTQIPSISFWFTPSHKDSQSFASSQIQITSRFSHISQFSITFTQTFQMHSIWFSCTPDSDQLGSSKIHSFSFSFTQAHSYLLRLVHCDLDFFTFA